MLNATRISFGRLGYRFAYLLIVADRRIRRSKGRGVKMIVRDSDARMLLVRHTYGSGTWTFPGGRVGRDEPAATAAQRELLEELELDSPGQVELGRFPLQCHRRLETITVYLSSRDGQDATPREIEIAAAGWFEPNELPVDVDPQVSTAIGLLDGYLAELRVSV